MKSGIPFPTHHHHHYRRELRGKSNCTSRTLYSLSPSWCRGANCRRAPSPGRRGGPQCKLQTHLRAIKMKRAQEMRPAGPTVPAHTHTLSKQTHTTHTHAHTTLHYTRLWNNSITNSFRSEQFVKSGISTTLHIPSQFFVVLKFLQRSILQSKRH